ncbi:MAG: hydroxyacid dehydrogenase [Candidatus Hodarchaeaceae archaeon]|nr:hydroxyacid dehydrogenase [Candidatus Hodarchaeaceae archaeon]
MSLVKILVTDKIHEDGAKLLKGFAEVSVATGLTSAELLERIKGYDVLVVRSATKVTKEVIDAGKQLRVIARAGAGLDNIDVKAAEARGIKVVNAPEAPTVAVAELVFAHMLSFARHMLRADASMKRGEWEKEQLIGTELRGKTLGIVGTGRIGRAVGYKAKAFLMNLLLYDVVQNREFAKQTEAKYVELDTLLRESDYVTLHVPLLPETEHMIGARELGLMKPTAVLINTSRGEVVDEMALAEALQAKKIAGACLDVYEREPPQESPLLKLPNVVLTPHLGASTVESQRDAAVIIAKKIKEALV